MAAGYLTPTDQIGRESIRESRSCSTTIGYRSQRLHQVSPLRVHAAFGRGFDIARRSPFKLLREGATEDREPFQNAEAEAHRRGAARHPQGAPGKPRKKEKMP